MQMPKMLTDEQIETFRRDGCVFPIRVMSADAAFVIRARLEAFEARAGGPLQGNLRHKTHLLFPWLDNIVHHPRIVDAIEDLHGPDLLCWTTNFFIKEKQDPAFVSWHQDSTYWGLSKPDVVTAWVALTPSNASNGAMAFIPGTHTSDQIPHRDTFAQNNLLTRGQEVAVEDSASLVRGEDRFHHFELEPRPTRDMDPAFVALHRAIAERNARILYRGTQVKSFNDVQALPARGGM